MQKKALDGRKYRHLTAVRGSAGARAWKRHKKMKTRCGTPFHPPSVSN